MLGKDDWRGSWCLVGYFIDHFIIVAGDCKTSKPYLDYFVYQLYNDMKDSPYQPY